MANENNADRNGVRSTPDSRPFNPKNPSPDEHRRGSERSRDRDMHDDAGLQRSRGDRQSQAERDGVAKEYSREGGRKLNDDSGAV